MYEEVPGCFPHAAKIMFVAESPGSTEGVRGVPLVGASGREFDRWLIAAGIARIEPSVPPGQDGRFFPKRAMDSYVDRSAIAITNAINIQLPQLTYALTNVPNENQVWPKAWLNPKDAYHIRRVEDEIEQVNPDVIVTLGAFATWMVTGFSAITKLRGTVIESRGGYPTVPTFHPSFVLRGRRMHAVTCIADFVRAWQIVKEGGNYGIPTRRLWTSPTLTDLEAFAEILVKAPEIAVDIETMPLLRELTHIGFAASATEAICVPIAPGAVSYWPSVEAEVAAIKWCRAMCELPQPKVLQNGLYDAAWLWDSYKIRLVNYREDTRLMMHALYPELPKTLGYMGSIFAREMSWKSLRKASEKGDDA